MEIRVQSTESSTEYGVRKDSRAKVESGLRPVQRLKGEYRNRGQSTEYRVRKRLYRGKVGAWQDRLQSAEYGVQSAGGARERQLGQHAVLPLPRCKVKRGPGIGIIVSGRSRR